MSQTGLVDISRFCSWNRLLRTTAYVHIFLRRLQDPSSPSNLTANEFQLAQETLLRQLHLGSFPAVLGTIVLRKGPLSSKRQSPISEPFHLRTPKYTIFWTFTIHTVTRSYPLSVVLVAQNAITRVLLVHFHEICHHAGPEYVKSFLQQRYFIFSVSAAQRTFSYRCFQCRHFRAENVKPKMAPVLL